MLFKNGLSLILTLAAFMTALFTGQNSEAQQMWGSGYYGGQQQCGYPSRVGTNAVSMSDEEKEARQNVISLKKDLKIRQMEKKRADTEMDFLKRKIERFFDSEIVDFLLTVHIEKMNKCENYKTAECMAPAKQATVTEQTVDANGKPVAAAPVADVKTACGEKDEVPDKLKDKWITADGGGYCTAKSKSTAGAVNASICADASLRPTDASKYRSYSASECSSSLSNYRKRKIESDNAQAKLERAEEEIREKEYAITDARERAKLDREYRLKTQVEGECEECMAESRGYRYEKPKTDWWNVAAQVGLGLGLGYIGKKYDETNMEYQAQLGYPPTQGYPTAVSLGLPFILGGVYGAINGGSGQGGFGCAGGMNGAGYPYGAGGYGGMNGGANGAYGPFGAQGGAFGYPQGMYGAPWGGGMYNPGLGAYGGFNGPNGGFPGGMNGQFGVGIPMNGQFGLAAGGGGYPGMAAGGGFAASGGIAMGGGYPGMGGYPGAGGGYAGLGGYPGAGGGGYPGMGMGGYPGMAAGGGFAASGGIAMGGGYPGMGGYPGAGGGGYPGAGGGGYPGAGGGGYPGAGGGGYPGAGGGGFAASGGLAMNGGYPGAGAGGYQGIGMGSYMNNPQYQIQLLQQQQQMLQQQQQYYQAQQQQQMQEYQRRVQIQQQAVQVQSEIASLQMRLQMLYSGAYSGNSSGGIYGGASISGGVYVGAAAPTPGYGNQPNFGTPPGINGQQQPFPTGGQATVPGPGPAPRNGR